MKAFAIVKYVFTLVGIGLLIGAFFTYRNTSVFLSESATAEGTVVDVVQSRSSSQRTYRPVVQFTSEDGQAIEFVSSFGSSPPAYSAGETVEVLYQPTNPQNARINSFFSFWFVTIILGGLSTVFLMIGVGLAFIGTLQRRKNDHLKQFGMRIETEFQSVERNTALSVNGRHPFRILSQWQNPTTSELHIFKSENLWFDPSSFIKSGRISVFIEKGNPSKYYVDLSFLPKLAE